LNRNFVYPVPVMRFALPLQRRIAGILSAYDELMENSQRRIRILEAMARALYREWFVHFHFPGHEKHPRVASPLGDIPQGWEVKPVKEILSRRAAGTVYREAVVKPEGTIPVLDQSTNELLGFHDNEPDHVASPSKPMAKPRRLGKRNHRERARRGALKVWRTDHGGFQQPLLQS